MGPQLMDAGVGDIKVADVDGDGLPDIIVGGQTISVLRGLGGGAFAAPVVVGSTGGTSIVLTDVSSDGKLDIVAIGTSRTVPGDGLEVLINQSRPGTVAFTAPLVFPVPAGFADLSAGDLNADTRPDIAAAAGNGVYVYYSCP